MKKKLKNERLMSPKDEAAKAAHEVWQEEFEEEMRFKEKLRKEGAKQERERIAERIYKVFPIEKKEKKELVKREEVFKIIGIDIQKLVADIESRKFFDPSYEENVLAWFNGTPPEKPIPLDGSVTRFVSLIADLMDTRPKILNNSKEFVYSYIESSFLFNGRKSKVSTIRQIMKPGINKNRVYYQSNSIPNIQDFRKLNTT